MSSEEGRERKRRRKIWSCRECRRRKLQCDRQWPTCSRCVKSGKADKCSYFDESAVVGTQRSTTQDVFPTPASTGPLHKASNHATPLEHVSSGPRAIEPPQDGGKGPLISDFNNKRNSIEHGTVQIIGNDFHTRCHGSTHCSSWINLIPELTDFAQEAFNGDASLRLLRQKMQDLKPGEDLPLSSQSALGDENLRALLPERSECDRLVQLYLNTFDYIYPVLHLPDFQRDYAGLWLNMPDTRGEFLVLVLIILAVALCLDGSHQETRLAREQADTILEAAESWLQRRARKYDRIIDYQIGFLHLFARQIRCKLYKRTWANAGRLVREFMCAGLHRSETSTNDRNMRRRLWLAAAEFELQAAFEQGMPPTDWTMQSDILEFGDLSHNAADERTQSDFSQSSYLQAASQTIYFRHSLNAALNDVRRPMSFEEAKQCTEAIHKYVAQVPVYADSRGKMVSSLLLITLYQYILALHERQLREASSSLEKSISRSILFETAAKLIDAHRAIINHGVYAIELLYNDQIRAALSICYVYTSVTPDSDLLLTWANSHAVEVMDQAVALIKQKVTRFGFGHRQLFSTLAAKWLMKAKNTPYEKQRFSQCAADEYKSLFDQDSRLTVGPSSSEVVISQEVSGASQQLPASDEVFDLSLYLDKEWMLDLWGLEPFLDVRQVEGAM